MRLRRLIKKNASLALRRHWCRSAAIALIMLIFWALFATLEQLVSVVFKIPAFVDISSPQVMLDNMPNTAPIAMAVMISIAVLHLFIVAPLEMGAMRWFYFVTDGKALPTIEIFDSFFSLKKYFRSIALKLLLFVIKTFWSIVFLAPPVLMIVLGDYWRNDASRSVETLLSTGLLIFGVVLLLLFSLFLLMWQRRYCFAKYMFAADEEISAVRAIKRSIYISRGRLFELLMLEISFIGWHLAGIFILPKLFTVGYFSTVYSLYARYLLELNFGRNAARKPDDFNAEQDSALEDDDDDDIEELLTKVKNMTEIQPEQQNSAEEAEDSETLEEENDWVE